MSDKTTADLERAIQDAVVYRQEELVALAATLIRYDTTAANPSEPSRREEVQLQEFLEARLRAAGGETELWEPDVSELSESARQLPAGLTFEGRPQLIARFRGRERGAQTLLLNGHIDVVSAEPVGEWSHPPYEPIVIDGALYGRGACDMKGGVACAVFAAEVLADLGIPLAGGLVVNIVTDEETSGAGAIASAAHGVRATAGIVPEATDFKVWTSCRGSLLPTIRVRGRPGHAELEQPAWQRGGAVNAIDKARIIMNALDQLRARWQASANLKHPRLLHPDIVSTMITAGEWQVTHPALCSIGYDITYLPQQADDEGWGSAVEEEFVAAVVEAAAADDWLREHQPSVSWGIDVPPVDIVATEPIVQLVLGLGPRIRREVAIAERSAWHDGVTFTRVAATPSVAFGPVGLDQAHAINEHVMVDDLVACAQALALAAYRFAGERH